MDKLEMQTKNITDENIDFIESKFPNVVTETKDIEGNLIKKIDFDILKQELTNDIVIDSDERYSLSWPGKKDAILSTNKKINKTLRPYRKDSLNFDDTSNLYIEGDNLDALKLLRETYLGKIKMIYIDPPYNTGNDFIYKDNFSKSSEDYLESTGQIDEEGNKMVQNLESNGRFHSDWLSMIYPRLKLAKDLLSEDGAIFISIDDNEQAKLEQLCDEVFNERNFVCSFVRQTRKGGGSMSRYVSTDHDYVLMYAKNINSLNKLFLPYDKDYAKRYNEEDKIGRYFWDTFARNRQGSSNFYDIKAPDGTILSNAWIYKEDKFLELLKKGDVRFKKTPSGWSVQCKQRISEEGQVMRSILTEFTNEQGTKEMTDLLGKNIFSYCKPTGLIKHFATAMTKDDDIVLDFFSGSATTAHATMQLNAEDGGHRKFIMVQIPEKCAEDSDAYKAGYKNICEIGEERIRRAGKKIVEENPSVKDTLDIGFRVLKLDSSNMKDVYYNPNDYTQDLLTSLEDNIKEDRTPLDLVFQVMLDLGVTLDSKIEEKTINGKKVFIVREDLNETEPNLVCCFDSDIDNDTVIEMAKLKPEHAVFRDSSMSSDSVFINVDQIFESYSPNTDKKVI